MRFGVLGPLEVWSAEGRPVRVPELKVRALLADLLVHRGRPVSVDRLIDDLWATKPPGSPVSTTRAKVSQLRRVLDEAEAGGRELVAYLPSGYVLQVDADAVDAGRFQALARQAQETDDPHTRAALLGEALALWRGPAFADFADSEFTRAEIRRLEEQRLVAMEDLAEARLELGQHSLLASELGDLVAEHPLRERLRAAHVQALYMSGRQNEALSSYGELRDRLRDELGLDPGPELKALHQAILEQDPALGLLPPPARPRTNLPNPLTHLIGRADAVTEIGAVLRAKRLVTLTGPGGVGKTRLAIETASQQADAYPDGVWLVELASLHAPSLEGVVGALTTLLGIRDDDASSHRPVNAPRATGAPAERLLRALRGKRMLLVLDNCEHVVEPVAELAALLLRSAPGLRILATSQEPLGLAGEQIWSVPPLDLPNPDDDLAALQQSSAVQLFVERASAASQAFVLDASSAEAVTAICRRLDGIPLALELAATRVRALGVRDLAARLDDRFRVLGAAQRGVPARQQTLRAMIDWSWELLTEPERIVLRRLAVHADGCTLEAAEHVCAGEGVKSSEVLDLLARLVDRSLVAVTQGPRYRLLESVAAYCTERMRESGEFHHVRERHYRYYSALAEQADPHLRGHDQQPWLERLDQETGNLRTALESAAAQHDVESALRLVNALSWYWFLHGRIGEALRSLETALEIDGDASEAVRARATAWQAGLTLRTADTALAADQAMAGLKPYEEINDPQGLAHAQWFLGFAMLGYSDVSISEELTDRALAGFRAVGDRWGNAAALCTGAVHALLRGDLITLRRYGEESLATFRDLGDRWGQLQSGRILGHLAEVTGDYTEAVRLHDEGLLVAEELRLWTEVSDRLSGLGRIALLTGDHARADELHTRAAQTAAAQGYTFGEEFAETGLALSARRQGKLDLAEKYLRKWLDWCRRVKGDSGAAFILAELGFLYEQRGDAAEALALHTKGLTHARMTNDPRAIALALEGLAGAHALSGHHTKAAELLGAATATRDSIGVPLPAAERGDVDRITQALTSALGPAAFTTAFTNGQTHPRH
ncbi:BTAD domain-containing putative transcriptional regulator [Actinomadura rudentiformis]|uniref:Tetratricopeptide repeat protein n=1 Tax=Actinomadura rudentiformis TaxID=359158 RepID=A0A6H9YUV2_9ACTN|nr:BTAD domain-containing putative transcriptional regulator [Actinomadura rudentiformis]KAB2350839.1 tetratricopeptide repeat protein [Actinomadura rudentiformis]